MTALKCNEALDSHTYRITMGVTVRRRRHGCAVLVTQTLSVFDNGEMIFLKR